MISLLSVYLQFVCSYSVHTSTVHHNFWTSQVVWSRLKSTCRCQVKSSQMCSSRPPSTWGHFSLKSGHVSLPQQLAGLLQSGSVTCGHDYKILKRCIVSTGYRGTEITSTPTSLLSYSK